MPRRPHGAMTLKRAHDCCARLRAPAAARRRGPCCQPPGWSAPHCPRPAAWPTRRPLLHWPRRRRQPAPLVNSSSSLLPDHTCTVLPQDRTPSTPRLPRSLPRLRPLYHPGCQHPPAPMPSPRRTLRRPGASPPLLSPLPPLDPRARRQHPPGRRAPGTRHPAPGGRPAGRTVALSKTVAAGPRAPPSSRPPRPRAAHASPLFPALAVVTPAS